MQGGLKRSQVEEALGHPIQVTIPDLPRQIANFVSLGQPATVTSFRNAMAEIAGQIGIAKPKDAAVRTSAWLALVSAVIMANARFRPPTHRRGRYRPDAR